MILGLFSNQKIKPHVNNLLYLLAPLYEAVDIAKQPIKKLVQDSFIAGYIWGVLASYLSQPEIKALPWGSSGKILVEINDRFGFNIFSHGQRLSALKVGENPDFDKGHEVGRTVTRFFLGDDQTSRSPAVLAAIGHLSIEADTERMIQSAKDVSQGLPGTKPGREPSKEEILKQLVHDSFELVVKKRSGW
jgi:hypothetical protein